MKVTFGTNDSQTANTSEPLNVPGVEVSVQPTLIRKKELARRLSVSTRTIDNWMSKRLIPYIEVNPRFYLYELDAVLEAIKKHYQIEPLKRD